MTHLPLAVHKTILVVDVEGFGNQCRTNPHQLAVREGLYRSLRHALSAAEITWADCQWEDRGDGVLVLVPSEVPKARVVESMPTTLVAALCGHNDAHGVEERIRLRMAVHAGEVHYDDHGVVGTSVNLAFRLVEASALKAALADSTGVLALVASSWFFEEVIRHSPASNPAGYRPVRITVKETSTVGWISLPGCPYHPPDNAASATDLGFPVPIIDDVVGPVSQVATTQQAVLSGAYEPGYLPVPRQLPPGVRDFVGRAGDLAALNALLPSGHGDNVSTMIVVLEGTAGVGKTTLAVHWAHRVQHQFPDGTLFANLRGHGPSALLNPALALASFLQALGIPEDRVPADLDAKVNLYRSLLAGRRALVLLDNAATPDQVRPLLPATPACLALVTSRSALTGLVVAETAACITLDMFSPTEAAILVHRIIGDRRSTAEPDAVTRLIAACVRLPLALRVAATRVAARPHTQIADIVTDITEDRNRLDV